MRGCALRKVVRNLAHKKLENRGVEPQHLPSQIPRPAPTGWSPVGWWMAEKPGAEGSPRSLRNTHRESVSGCVGFRLGFVYHSPRSAGSGLFQSA